jgi:hypothetical protein
VPAEVERASVIARLFESIDIDYGQWTAMTKAALIVDLRTSMFVRGRQGQQVRAISAIISQMIFYTVMGAFVGAFVVFSGDLFLSANLVLAYVMFMVGTAALVDHNAAITSPDDYHILGFRPVTSRTYFAARVANVLVYTTAMTTLFAYVPIGAFIFRWGAGVGLSAIVAVYLASMFMAFGMIAVYSWLLRVIGAERIKRVLSYVQFSFSFVVYGGYFVASRMLSKQMLTTMSLPKTTAVFLLPPTWFASYMELAAGRWSLTEIIPVAVSLLAIAGLVSLVSGRLSLDYADRLGAISVSSSPVTATAARAARPRRSFWFRAGEARAIALLIRSQFANDMKFRMSVLGILPLTIIYLLMGLSRSGAIADPFRTGDPSRGLGMVTIAMMMFPAMLKMSLGRSDAFRASWIFFSTPSDRTRLIAAAKNVLVVTFLIPYVAAVALVVGYFSENVPHLLIHLSLIALLSHLVLQVITIFDPELPFSRPLAKGRSSTRVFVIVMCVSVGAVFFPLVAPMIYRSPVATVLTFLTVIGISVLMEWLIRLRIEAQSSRLEFEG